jgi:ferric-dicitrate binding protein FerR (iron transport regulator)
VYLSDNNKALHYDTISFLDDSLLAQTPDSTLPTKPKLRSKNNRNVVMITYTTVDSAKAFYLPDNSIVFLNDHSSLSYAKDFGAKNRNLNLSGEAYFEPVEDTIPFIVNCANTSSKAGVKSFFNVRENKTAGSVEVLTVSGDVEFTGVTNKVYKKLTINEGERAVYSKDATLMKEKNKQKDYKWWQKKNLRAKLRSLFDRIKNAFK